MTRRGQPRYGDGTAWLVGDRVTGDYLCYWYTGTADDRLVEHARAASAEEAVAWGRQRTPLVRIRTPDALTFWAGTAPRPEGFFRTWTQDDAANADCPDHTLAGSLPLGLACHTSSDVHRGVMFASVHWPTERATVEDDASSGRV